MLSRREHFKENFHAAWASDSSNSPEARRESENTNNLFHQAEISLIVLPVAEPERIACKRCESKEGYIALVM
jgi:hypothetical protein